MSKKAERMSKMGKRKEGEKGLTINKPLFVQAGIYSEIHPICLNPLPELLDT